MRFSRWYQTEFVLRFHVVEENAVGEEKGFGFSTAAFEKLLYKCFIDTIMIYITFYEQPSLMQQTDFVIFK